jgi:multiple sugar transport system ATP-binding protein
MPAIELEHVTKIFHPAVHALSDFSLSVNEGELLVLLGPSGCGKTTALRIIAGLERPSSGRIRLAGRDVTDIEPRQRDVAMVFQKSTLYPHLNVRDNLAFGLRMREGASWLPGRRRQLNERVTERVIETARVLQIEHLLDRLPAQLSGGQQQRVALGRALVRRPTVYLLDEPLSHLDFRLRAELRRELHLLHRRLRGTMVYVTHDPTEALALGDRLALIDCGQLLQSDAPALVSWRPASRRVAEFFGWPPMNFFEGSLVEEDGKAVFRFAGDMVLAAPGVCGLGGSLTLGIRPENVCVLLPDSRMAEFGKGAELGRMQVIRVEDRIVTLRRGACQLTGVARGNGTATVGQDLDVMVDTEQLHWFDCKSGLALAHGVPTG